MDTRREVTMDAGWKRQAREPIALSIVVVGMMLVILSHARLVVFAWAGFLLATIALILVNQRYLRLLRASSREDGRSDR
jgi:hypothetical protein